MVAAGAGAHYELEGLTEAADPGLVAALAGWCAERGLLITELRLGAASLEERYLELVGEDVAAEAEGIERDEGRRVTALPVGAGVPARPASRLQMAMALAAYEFELVLRRGEGLLITFVIPAGVLLIFSSFDTGGGTGSGDAVDRHAPGLGRRLPSSLQPWSRSPSPRASSASTA